MNALIGMARYVFILFVSVMGMAHAAITVYGGTARNITGAGSLNLNPNAAGTAGDLLVAQIVTKSSATITPPAGWTKLTAASTTTGTLQQAIYYYTAWDGNSATDQTFAITGITTGNSSNGVIFVLDGASTTSPVCGTNLQTSGGGTGMNAPNLHVTCAAGSARMALFASNDGSPTAALNLENSATAGPSNRAGSGATGVGLFSSYFLMGSSGNGDAQTGNLSGSGAVSIGATVIINVGPVSPPASIHHIQLEISGTPLTCTASTVTVKACTNAACTTLASSSAAVTLSASSGTLGSSLLTFTGSTTTTLSKTTTGTTTLGATSLPASSNATTCMLNGSTAASCQYTFADSGFLLSTVSQQTAGQTSGSVTLSAVRKSDNSLACTPAFASVTRSVKFTPTYSNPSTGTITPVVNGVTNAGGGVSLNFDSFGKANFTFSYADAGNVSLNARYDGTAGAGDAGLVMTGSSNTFLSIPFALCVDSPDSNWNCVAADTSCAKFTSAGTAFNLRVTAKAYLASTPATCSLPTTPNYIQSNLALSSTLVAPGGGVNASLSPATINVTSGGTATQASQTVSEVGVFTITATPTAGDYFGQTVASGTSSNSGRFVPAGFSITSNTINDRSDINTTTTVGGAETCASSFTYLGESLRSLFLLTAVNASGVATKNYFGSFARLNMNIVANAGSNGLAFGAQSGTTLLNARLTSSCASCGAFSAGVSAIAADLTVRRSTGSTLDAPFAPPSSANTSFGVVATDPDGVGMRTPTYNWDLSGAADGLPLGSTALYFGRIRVDNAYGSQLNALPVALYAQYWNGTAFVPKADDNCSRFTVPPTYAMSITTLATLSCNGGVGLYGALTGVTATAGAVTAGNPATLASGSATLRLSKPTNSGGGYLDLVPSVADYLKYNVDNVDQSGASCSAVADTYLHDDNPRARIRFGTRGNDTVLYLREVY